MSKRDTDILLEDMLESIDKILRYTEGMSAEAFMADEKTIDAVVRNIEIIGEVVAKIPEDTRAKYVDIDWIRIRGMRNRLIHEYFGVDVKIVWTVRDQYLPELRDQIQEMLTDLKGK